MMLVGLVGVVIFSILFLEAFMEIEEFEGARKNLSFSGIIWIIGLFIGLMCSTLFISFGFGG